jgi:hypothetical protein
MSTYEAFIKEQAAAGNPTHTPLQDFVHILTLGPVLYIIWEKNAETAEAASAFCDALTSEVHRAYGTLSAAAPGHKVFTVSNLSLGLVPFTNRAGSAALGNTLRRLQTEGVWAGGVAFGDEMDMRKRLSVSMVGARLRGFREADDIYNGWDAALAAINRQDPVLGASKALWDVFKKAEARILNADASHG